MHPLTNSKTPQVIESYYHGNRDTVVTSLFEGSWSSYLGNVFCNTIYCYGNNIAMATDKCISLIVLLDGLQRYF